MEGAMSDVRIGPARRGLIGACRVPSDKSIAHRALLLGAAADGLTRIQNCQAGADNRRTMDFVRALGVAVREGPSGEIRIAGGGWDALRVPTDVIDCGNSGTTMRLGAGLIAGRAFEARLTGDASLQRRPMGRIIEPLRAMGADIRSEPGDGRPPLLIRGGLLRGITHRLQVASAQVKSAVLIAGLQAAGETVVLEPEPTRDHTELLLASFGVSVRVEPYGTAPDPVGRRISVLGGSHLQGASVSLPGDFSSAAFFIVAALLVEGSDLIIEDVGLNPTRTGLLEVLRAMGASYETEVSPESAGREPIGTVRVRSSALRGTAVDGRMIPRLIDEVPLLCVAAACAEGATTVTGAAELRVKESDRIAAMATELRARGVGVEELPDGLVIEGNGPAQRGRLPLKGGLARAYGDHRMAMAMAVAGLVAEGGIRIAAADAELAEVSFPDFHSGLQALMRG